jgi:hypothetical protein
MGMDPAIPIPIAILGGAPVLVIVLNAVIAAVIGAVAAIQLGADDGAAFGVGAAVFVVFLVTQLLWGGREARRERPEATPMFPTPAD